ncbi:hypothetical protein JOM56_008178 [Amanita muscaria]
MFRTGGYWVGDIVRLTLFPELCRPGQAFTLCRDIAMSLRRNLCKRYHVVTYCSFEIHIFDFTHAEAATICKVVEGMAQYIVRCEIFTMRVHGKGLKPWRIPGFLTSASQLRQLRCLTFELPDDDSLGSLLQTAMDLRSFLLEELILTCPTVKEAFVDNHSGIPCLSYTSWEISIMNRP